MRKSKSAIQKTYRVIARSSLYIFLQAEDNQIIWVVIDENNKNLKIDDVIYR